MNTIPITKKDMISRINYIHKLITNNDISYLLFATSENSLDLLKFVNEYNGLQLQLKVDKWSINEIINQMNKPFFRFLELDTYEVVTHHVCIGSRFVLNETSKWSIFIDGEKVDVNIIKEPTGEYTIFKMIKENKNKSIKSVNIDINKAIDSFINQYLKVAWYLQMEYLKMVTYLRDNFNSLEDFIKYRLDNGVKDGWFVGNSSFALSLTNTNPSQIPMQHIITNSIFK